ncbi:MAG TPA: GTP-binding protein [Puia sp.]|nr:GTP-binding protein [Puia sp.]
MKKRKLIVVGGFLGSGKTTAIHQAARCLRKDHKKAGMITNDHGTLHVDTAFMKGQGIPTAEVSAGCFCCHYAELADRIEWLLRTTGPDIIFAEPVGSCVDLAATVINPLLTANAGRYDVVLSVFADSRLLLAFLTGNKPVFSDNVNYIYENQLREADILVVNKIDLLAADQLEWAKERMGREYGDKIVLFQNSLAEESVGQWLACCDNYSDRELRPALDIDYGIYGAGEAQLAWMDEEIGIVSPDANAVRTAYELMQMLHRRITGNGWPIGHLKFLLDDGQEQKKVSFTTIPGDGPAEPADAADAAHAQADRAVVIVNARIHAAPELVRQLTRRTILDLEAATGCRITEHRASAFRPGYPRPTHRIIKRV